MKENKVIFASAGSGKTYSIVKEAINKSNDSNKLILLISYTNLGTSCLEQELKQQTKYQMNRKIEIKTWYSFLLNECIKPYQCLLHLKSKFTGKIFNIPPNYINSIEFNENKDSQINYAGHENVEFYLNKQCDVIQNNASHLAHVINYQSESNIIHRLEDIYSYIFIDEVQDYASWDLEFFNLLLDSNINMVFVGDTRQATFVTNNGTKNSQYKRTNIKQWFEKKEKEGKCIIIHKNETRRFNKYICKFVNSIYPDDKDNDVIPDESLVDNEENQGVYIINEKDLKEYCNYYHPIILRWDKRAKIKDSFSCQVFNYGVSKGMTFDRTIIYVPRTINSFILKQNEIKQKETKSKFYVACTRAKHSIVFIIDENIKESKNFINWTINLPERKINCYKYEC